MLLDAADSQLVLVDYQTRLLPAIHEAPLVLANAVRLARMAQVFRIPVFGTEQNPEKLGGNDAALRALCQKTLSKMSFSAVDAGLP
ncbi:MAG: isochorismatase family protein, partial [Gammaproteobacteria bacterium]|nr:isochorismatase family protein [Gammaproteobacteria bacterium]